MARVLFGDSGVNENEAVDTGGGHESKKFGVFEAVKAIDVKVDNPKVVFEPRVPVMIEFERLGIEVKEVGEGCGSKRVPVLRRFCWRRGRRIVRGEPRWDESVRLKGDGRGSRGAVDSAPGVQ